MAACEVCGKGPAPNQGGVSVFRMNTPGALPAIWRCREHAGGESALAKFIDGETLDIVGILEGREAQGGERP
jgi:hypothetical protein